MITKEQLLEMDGRGELHFGDCRRKKGPRGGIKETIHKVQLTGKCKTWKTRPTQFQQPITYGLYESWHLTHIEAYLYHLPSECPLDKEGENK